MLRVLYGNEPYLIDSKINEARKEVSDISFVKFNDFTEEVVEFAAQYPFYDTKQVAIVYMPKLDKNDKLIDYIDNPSDTTDIYISVADVDKRSNLFKKLKKGNMLEECNKLNSDLFQKFVLREISRNNSKIDKDNFLLFQQKSGYLESEDVTLYTIKIYLKQLGYNNEDGIISERDIEAFVTESLDQKSILLSKYLLLQNETEMFNMARLLIEKKENPITLLSLIARSFRLAYKATLYGELDPIEISSLIGVPTYQFKEGLRYNAEVLEKSLNILQNGVNQIKDGEANSEIVFYITLGSIITLLKENNL